MSRFISGGLNDDRPSPETTQNDEAWLAAQRQIDATRLSHPFQPGTGQQDGGKSLYETLQANKAAKQEAFEESTRLRNQFRPLDADEIEFLDAVNESTRKREDEVRRETGQQLEAFRAKQRRDEAAAAATAAAAAEEGENGGQGMEVLWAVGPRKRKKGGGGGAGGLKIRRMSSAVAERAEDEVAAAAAAAAVKDPEVAGSPPVVSSARGLKVAERGSNSVAAQGVEEKEKQGERRSPNDVMTSAAKHTPPPSTVGVGLGLAAYSSDEDD